jgi:hypothetical protein
MNKPNGKTFLYHLKMNQRYFLTGLLLLTALMTSGQERYFGYTYSVSVPMSGIDGYINNVSFRGVNFEGFNEVNKKIAIGFLAGWNVFSEKRSNELYVIDNVTIKGDQYRYMNLFPILARGLYMLGTESGIRTYVGADVGVTSDVTRTDLGLYSIRKKAWHVTVAPELGINLPVAKGSITGSLRYDYSFKTADLGHISYLSFNLGYLFSVSKRPAL